MLKEPEPARWCNVFITQCLSSPLYIPSEIVFFLLFHYLDFVDPKMVLTTDSPSIVISKLHRFEGRSIRYPNPRKNSQ